MRTSAANILTLDRLLARYSPETRPIRETMKKGVAFRIETTWPEDGPHWSSGLSQVLATSAIEDIENRILQLTPSTDTQRWFKSEALKLSEEVLENALAGSRQPGRLRADVFLAVVVLWLTVTFTSFGLYTPVERVGHRGPFRRGVFGRGGRLPHHGAGRAVRGSDQSVERAAALRAVPARTVDGQPLVRMSLEQKTRSQEKTGLRSKRSRSDSIPVQKDYVEARGGRFANRWLSLHNLKSATCLLFVAPGSPCDSPTSFRVDAGPGPALCPDTRSRGPRSRVQRLADGAFELCAVPSDRLDGGNRW